MAKFVWQDGTLVSKAKVEVGGTIYEVDPEEYSGSTPLSASNLNTMVDNIYDDMTKSDVYSTTETAIGTWINGKTIYRKVIQFTTGSSDSSMIYNDNNLDTLIKATGFISYGSGYHKIGGYANSSYYSLIQYNSSEKKLYIYYKGYSSKNGYMILEYTKN